VKWVKVKEADLHEARELNYEADSRDNLRVIDVGMSDL